MRIKILVCMFGRGRGGLEYVFLDHIKALVADGFDVYAACHCDSPYRDAVEEITGKPATLFSAVLIYNPFLYKRILNTAKRISPDIIFLHGNRAISVFTNPLFTSCLPAPIKLVATAHNYRNKRFTKLDASLAISHDLMKDLESRGIKQNRIFYCPNSVSLQEKKEFTFHNPPVIGALGRLHTVKGYDLLIRAAKLLKEERKILFNIIFAGGGPEQQRLIDLAKTLGVEDEIKFVGWVNDKTQFFNTIDIFCMPSRSEGLPISLLEALSYSKPCVVSDCPGPAEVVSHLNAGCIVKKESPDQLANALQELIINKKQTTEMAENGWKTIRDIYTFEKLCERLKSICQHILEL